MITDNPNEDYAELRGKIREGSQKNIPRDYVNLKKNQEAEEEKMKKKPQIWRNNLIAILAGGSILALSNLGLIRETSCETYQGYIDNSSEGERIFVFDEKTLQKRGTNEPNYALSGNPHILKKDNLEIGRNYRLTIKNHLIGSERLIAAEHCENNSK